MPRYLIERTFSDGLHIPTTTEGATALGRVIDTNTQHGVTWVCSYVSEDKRSTFCIYDAPSPEAIRKVADANRLPIDRITKVSVLDPYFYF